MALEPAQRAVSDTALWHLRVLAGWLPPRGVGIVRALAAWFEVGALEELTVAIATARGRPDTSYSPGALGTVWARAASAVSLAELRGTLAHSAWGDPGSGTLPDILLGLRLGWARLLRRTLGEHPEWGDGALALAVAKALFLQRSESHQLDPKRVPELGTRWADVREIGEFAVHLAPTARWVLQEVHTPDDLWRADRDWWVRIERNAAALLRTRPLDRPVVVGAAATLLADCWRTRTALGRAARGSAAPEATDAQT